MNYFKLLLTTIALFIFLNTYAQSEWEPVSSSNFSWETNGNVKIESRTTSLLVFHNYHALTADNKYDNTFTWKEISMSLVRWIELRPWKISFEISNLNNRPDLYKYGVINEYGKSVWHKDNVYWGFELEPYGNQSTLRMSYGNTKYSFIENKNKSGWTRSYKSAPLTITVEYDGESTIRVYCDYSIIHTFYNTTALKQINILAGPAAKVKVENFSVKRKTLYGDVKQYIDNGDSKYSKEDYWGAVEEYSKAISKGYYDYDIYYKRASAYYCIEFFNNAIDDYSKALSYKKTEDAYFFRGLAKLYKGDMSGIEDLKQGGLKGLALVKEFEEYGSGDNSSANTGYIASGTGFFIDARGYIVTNYHVIDKANNIDVFVTKDGKTTTYKAIPVVYDKTNDLAIIKIDDLTFSYMPVIPYVLGNKTTEVGTSVFAMGYPELSYLGEEIKVTDGIISSKSGYQGDITSYQISAPVQPGNSGGPLFDSSGNLIGIINAGIPSMQNVGYAIKVSYLTNLIEASPEAIQLPSSNKLSGLSLADKVKKVSPYVVIIKTK